MQRAALRRVEKTDYFSSALSVGVYGVAGPLLQPWLVDERHEIVVEVMMARAFCSMGATQWNYIVGIVRYATSDTCLLGKDVRAAHDSTAPSFLRVATHGTLQLAVVAYAVYFPKRGRRRFGTIPLPPASA